MSSSHRNYRKKIARLANPTLTAGGFPRIIHQTWKTEEIPEHWALSKKNWLKYHPDWLHVLWTDSDIRRYIAERHPAFLALHDFYPYSIQRADMIRYFVLHDFGGIYSDLDLYPTENVEAHLGSTENCFVFSGFVKTFTNCFMVSKQGSALMAQVVAALADPWPWWSVGKHLTVMASTGPYLLDRVLLATEYPFTVLPRKKFMAYSAADPENTLKPGALLHPLGGGSWHSWDSKLLNFFFQHGRKIVIFITIVVVCFFLHCIFFIKK
jgi:mannosyltransferase OCH1-like enzyme